jgi:hypothetical protein
MRAASGQPKIEIEDLIEEYRSKGIAESDSEEDGGVKDASELDDFGEDEMAAAIAAAEAGEDNGGGAQDQAAIDAMLEGGAEAGDENQSQEAIDAMLAGGGETQDQAAIDAMLEGGGEVQDQAAIDAMLAGETLKSEALTKPEEIDGKLLLKQRLPTLPKEKLFQGRAILSEIYMDHMYFFSGVEFLEGQSIVLEFRVPKKFIMNAQVVFCRSYNMKSRVISKNRLPFRVGVKFTYLKDGERTILRQFVQSIEPDLDAIAAAAPVPVASGGGSSNDDDDFDFDDLE